MPETLGYSSYSGNRSGGRNSDNVIADTLTVPDNGWITEVRLAGAGGNNEATSARLSLWEQAGALLWASPQQAWSTGLAQRVAAIPGAEVVRVVKNQQLYAGFWRDPGYAAQWGLTGSITFDRHQAMTYTAALAPPDPFTSASSFFQNLAVSVLFERNAKPLKGAWRTPTPAGSTGELNPYFSGTLPHAGAGAYALASGYITIDATTGEPRVRAEPGGGFLISYAATNDPTASMGPLGLYTENVIANTENGQSIEAATATTQVQSGALGNDGAYDESALVRVYVQRTRDNAVIVDTSFEPTDTEIAQGYFERQIYALPNTNEEHVAYFLHRDEWGIWSEQSDGVSFKPYAGPASPASIGPEGKQASGAAITYSSTYTHGQGLSAKAARVKVYGRFGLIPLYDSGVVTLSPQVAPGGIVNVASTFHPALKEGGVYQWHMQTQDSANIWSAWGNKKTYSVNRPPAKPSFLFPTAGLPSFNTVLRAFVFDRDLDTIAQAQVDLFLEDGTHLAVYPKNMGIDPTGFWATYDAVADLVQGSDYKFNVRANDGIQWGEWSDFAHFKYITVPMVTMYSPKQDGVTNLARQPSAEGDPATVSDWWDEWGENATNYTARVVDGNALEGVVSWEMVSDGTATHGFQSLPITIDPTKSYFLRAGAKKISGTSKHKLLLRFENGSGTAVATIAPLSLRQLDHTLATPDVPSSWTQYGGLVLGSDIPDTATRMRVYVERTSGGSASVVRFDAFMPVEVQTASLTNFRAVQGFWGYVDGDTEGFGSEDDHVWQALPHDSISAGPARLVSPAISAEIGYSSSSAKTDDRYVLEQKSRFGGLWAPVYSTAYSSAGARTVIPIPTTVVRNAGRYGLTVYARNSSGLEGRTPRVEFDVEYAGPAEPRISQVAGDASRGEIVVNHDPTDLDPNVFSHWEIRVTKAGALGEGDAGSAPVTYISEDYAATRFVHSFPESDIEYTYELRVVQFLGAEQVESGWTTARGSVNYHPVFFLKSVADPLNDIVAFQMLASATPTETHIRPMKSYVTWGSTKPTVGFGKPDYETGSLTVNLHDLPSVPGFSESAETRLRTLMRMISKGGVWCFLAHYPTRKRFITMNGDPGRSVSEIEDLIYSIEHIEVQWLEDIFERQGSIT